MLRSPRSRSHFDPDEPKIQVRVFLTRQEKEQLDRLATEDHRSTSSYIRHILLGKLGQIGPKERKVW
jgi:hypothetical protein